MRNVNIGGGSLDPGAPSCVSVWLFVNRRVLFVVIDECFIFFVALVVLFVLLQLLAIRRLVFGTWTVRKIFLLCFRRILHRWFVENVESWMLGGGSRDPVSPNGFSRWFFFRRLFFLTRLRVIVNFCSAIALVRAKGWQCKRVFPNAWYLRLFASLFDLFFRSARWNLML